MNTEQQYFEKKATDFIEEQESTIMDGDKSALIRDLVVLLKEVARDQRHACVEAFNIGLDKDLFLKTCQGIPESKESNVAARIHNAKITK